MNNRELELEFHELQNKVHEMSNDIDALYEDDEVEEEVTLPPNTILSYPDMTFSIDTIPSGKLIACDTETTGFNSYKGAKAFLFSFANEEGDVSVVWRSPENDEMLKAFFADKSITKIFHNCKFDMKMCKAAGYPVEGMIHDTLVMSRLADENAHSHRLKDLSKKYNGYSAIEDDQVDAFKKQRKKDKNEIKTYMEIPEEILLPYAAVDAWNCMMLYYVFKEPMLVMKKAYALDMRNTMYSLEVEDKGMMLDKKVARELIKDLGVEAKELRKTVKELAGCIIEPDDKRSLCYALFAHGAVCKSWTKDKKTKQNTNTPSTDYDALEEHLDIPWVEHFIKFKKITKLRKTLKDQLLGNVDKKSILHTNFNISMARTRRASSSGPNLQNVEKKSKIREAFVCRPGYHMFYFDYSQVEYRVFAHFGGDKELVKGYVTGELDAHDLTMERNNVSRDIAKTVNFLILYGGGADALSAKLDATTQECKSIIEKWHDKTPSLRDLQDRLKYELAKNGHIEDPYGMHYHVLAKDEFKIVNTLIQGCAGSILKKAKLECRKLLKDSNAYMIGEIHDELIFEIPENDYSMVPKIKAAMEMKDINPLCVPLVVDVDYTRTHWGAKEKFIMSKEA